MIQITIDNKTFDYDSPVSAGEVAKKLTKNSDRLIALKVGNVTQSLTSQIEISASVEGVYTDQKEGQVVYRHTLSFILVAAAAKLFPKRILKIGHSLGKSYFYSFDDGKPLSDAELKKLRDEMSEIVKKDLPIKTEVLSYTQACTIFEKENLVQTRNQMNYKCPPTVLVNSLEGYYDIYYGPMACHTGIINCFDLVNYEDGFLLRFPSYHEPDKLAKFEDNPKIFQIYHEYKNWGKRIGVRTICDLNERILHRKINDFIDITETYQAQNYARVAKQISEKSDVKVVLIAGPSSSGKTTSAKKLALHLQALAYNPKVISLDNYYVGRDRNPKDENGNYDYECLEALDIPLLNQNLNDLFAGKEVQIPSYNFDIGQPYYTGETMKLEKNDILIMEGIHGLNDKLTPKVDNKYKFKIYLSALTQLNLDEHNRIGSSDNRLIRRIVRDARFRGKSAAATISMWPSVQKGELLHIFPFQNNADAVLNTALDYEIPVLKVYAAPLLRAVKPTEPEYSEACRLLRFLGNFDEIPETYIPKQSIVREFIGGSSFHY
ncbi:MAG: nucleoside kinase [Treponema sp.]|nr:nucleoside kinase [Treponema sp.]